MATYGTDVVEASYSRPDIPVNLWQVTPYLSGVAVAADTVSNIDNYDEAQNTFTKLCHSPKNYDQVILSKKTLVIPS